ncbi:hypothetical protein [Candidatus Odyssella acanthamoebae]|nr:hypothetical protein [Candidatus Paracaedibacter acanthamoebae]
MTISGKIFLAYKFQILGRLFFYTLAIYIFSQLWQSTGEIKSSILKVNVSDMIWYIAITEWGVLSEPYIYSRIQHDVKSGDITYHLLRPISYIHMILWEGLGTYLFNLFVFAVFGTIITGFISQSTSQLTGFIFVLFFLAIMSGALSLIIQTIIGLCAFWVGDVASFFMFYRMLMYILGGLLLPLNIYPIWLKSVAYLTPFPWMIYDRSKIIYTQNWSDCFTSFIGLLIWIGCFYPILTIIFKKFIKRIEIYGG